MACPRSATTSRAGRLRPRAAPSRAELVAHLDDTWARRSALWELHFVIVLPVLPRDQRVRRALPRPLRRRGPLRRLPAARRASQQDRRGRPRRSGASAAARWPRPRSRERPRGARRRATCPPRWRRPPRGARSSPSCAPSSSGTASAPTSWATRDAELDRGPDAGHRDASRTSSRQPDARRPRRRARARRRRARARRSPRRASGSRATPRRSSASSRPCSRPRRTRPCITEDHNFWIDCHGRSPGAPRRCSRAAAGSSPTARIDARRRRLHARPATSCATRARPAGHRPARARRGARAPRWRASRGVRRRRCSARMPAGPPPDDAVRPRIAAKFFGAPPRRRTSPASCSGHAGVARASCAARARVIRSIAEAGALQPGDILVAETTAPPWTPLFATAAAVVTDTGGILSHCAVVAREYGIPAVVGTGDATAAHPRRPDRRGRRRRGHRPHRLIAPCWPPWRWAGRCSRSTPRCSPSPSPTSRTGRAAASPRRAWLVTPTSSRWRSLGPFAGRLGDRHGRRRMVLVGARRRSPWPRSAAAARALAAGARRRPRRPGHRGLAGRSRTRWRCCATTVPDGRRAAASGSSARRSAPPPPSARRSAALLAGALGWRAIFLVNVPSWPRPWSSRCGRSRRSRRRRSGPTGGPGDDGGRGRCGCPRSPRRPAPSG